MARAAEAEFTVTITDIAGEQRVLLVRGRYMVRAVLEAISAADGVPVERLRLSFGLLLLDDARTLSDYNLQEGAVLTLVRNAAPLTPVAWLWGGDVKMRAYSCCFACYCCECVGLVVAALPLPLFICFCCAALCFAFAAGRLPLCYCYRCSDSR